MFNLFKGFEAVHRFWLWFAIGFLISLIGHFNESMEQQLLVVKRITETTVQQWNIVGVIGIVLLIFTFLLYMLKLKYREHLNDIFNFYRNSTAYTLVPTFSTASSLLGTMAFYLLSNATNPKEYLFSFGLMFTFFVITIFIWLMHAFIQEDILIEKVIISLKNKNT